MSIKKIADLVGVSASTVSRVLNNPDYRCSTPELRDKIWNAAIKMNYVPNEAARQLKTGVANVHKTYCIHVLMTRMDAVIQRMFEETDGGGDGLIVIGKCNRQALQKLEQCYRAAVYVNRDSSQGLVDEVICNGKKIASSAVEYLIALGRENIAIMHLPLFPAMASRRHSIPRRCLRPCRFPGRRWENLRSICWWTG